MFNNPPPKIRRSVLRRDAQDKRVVHAYDPVLLSFAIGVAGITGFLGLLIAGTLLQSLSTPLRALALIWFAVFGVWHVRTSSRIS